MKMLANQAPYLRHLIGGVTAILLGTSGIAAVMAWMPSSTEMAGGVLALDKLPTPSARSAGAPARVLPARAEGDAHVRVKCAECGVVASTREIRQLGAGIGPGAAGGVTRDGRNKIAGKPTKSYEVTVRMKDGSSRVFMNAAPANWRTGERVILIDGANQSND